MNLDMEFENLFRFIAIGKRLSLSVRKVFQTWP